MRHVAHANADRFLPGVPCFRRPHGECLLEKVSKRCFAAEMNDFLAESVNLNALQQMSPRWLPARPQA